jgi:hypothetical protein
MKTKIPLSILIFFIAVNLSTGQSPVPNGFHWRTSPLELQVGLGTAHYFGDIGGTSRDNNWMGIRDFEPLRSRLAFSGTLRFMHNRHLSYGISTSVGWLSGSDLGGRNERRDYVFNTLIVEPHGRVEYYPLRDMRIDRTGVDKRGMVRNYTTISAYIFAGAGAVFYNPFPNEKLQNRRERSEISHGAVTMVIPGGVGAKLGIRRFVDLGIEVGGRYAFNDYLDGFTSPTAKSNDIYYITTISLIYRLESLRSNPNLSRL